MSRRKDEGGGAGAGGSHAGRDTIFAFTACTMRDKQLDERGGVRGGEGRGGAKANSAAQKQKAEANTQNQMQRKKLQRGSSSSSS